MGRKTATSIFPSEKKAAWGFHAVLQLYNIGVQPCRGNDVSLYAHPLNTLFDILRITVGACAAKLRLGSKLRQDRPKLKGVPPGGELIVVKFAAAHRTDIHGNTPFPRLRIFIDRKTARLKKFFALQLFKICFFCLQKQPLYFVSAYFMSLPIFSLELFLFRLKQLDFAFRLAQFFLQLFDLLNLAKANRPKPLCTSPVKTDNRKRQPPMVELKHCYRRFCYAKEIYIYQRF